MTYKQIEEYLSLGTPLDSETKAYYALSALLKFDGFAALWYNTDAGVRDQILINVAYALRD